MLRKLLILILLVLSCMTVQAQSGQNCNLPGRMQVDRQGQVVVGNGSNRVRSEPSTQAQHLGDIPEGGLFTVIGGPYCAEDYLWWHVRYEQLEGWTVEGTDGVYWLEPIVPSTSSGEIPTPIAPLALAPNAITAENAAQVMQQARLGNGWITDAEWSPDSITIAVGTSLGVRLYNTSKPTAPARELRSDEVHINDVVFSSDGALFAAAGDDDAVHVWNTTTWEEVFTLQHDRDVNLLAFSPDGKWLAVADKLVFDSGSSRWIGDTRVWDTSTGTLYKIAQPEKAEALSRRGFSTRDYLLFSADSTHLIMSDSEYVVDWDLVSEEFTLLAGAFLAGWAITPDLSRIAFVPQSMGDGPTYQELVVVDLVNKQTLADRPDLVVSEHNYLRDLYFTPSGNLLLTVNQSGQLAVRDPEQFSILTYLTEGVQSVAFSPDGSLMAAGSDDGVVRLFATPTINAERQVYAPSRGVFYGISGAVTKVMFSQDGQKVAAIGADGTVRVWGAANGDKLATYRDFSFPFKSAVFSPDGKTIVSAGEHVMSVWDRKTQQTKLTFKNFDGSVQNMAFSPDNSTIAFNTELVKNTGETQNHFYLWDSITGDVLGTLDQSPGSLFFRGDGSVLLTTALRQVTLDNGQLVTSPLDIFNTYASHTHAAMSGNQQTLAFGYSRTAAVDIVDANTGTLLQNIDIGGWWIHDLALSQDGHWLAVYSENNNINRQVHIGLWNTTTGESIAQLDEGSQPVLAIALSADGSVLATGYDDGSIRLWDVVGNKEIATLQGHVGAVHDIVFSADGAWMVSASDDGTIRVWGVQALQQSG